MARASKLRRQRGHTLIEVAVSTGIFTVISAGVLTLVHSAAGVLKTTMNASVARRHCSDLASTLADELQNANPTNLSIDTSHAEGDRIRMQVPLSVTNGTVTWGALEHVDCTGHERGDSFVDYLLVRDPDKTQLWRLVRRVVDVNGGPIGADEVVLDQVDAVQKRGGKGFTATRSGHLVTLSLRVRHADSATGVGREDLVRIHHFTIQLRNSEETASASNTAR